MNLQEAIMEAYKEGLVDANFVVEKFNFLKKKKKNQIFAKDMPGGTELLNKLKSYTNSNITLPKDFESFVVHGGFYAGNGTKFYVRITYTDADKKTHELSGGKYDNIRKTCGAMMLKHRDSVPDDKKYRMAYFHYYNKDSAFLTADDRCNLLFELGEGVPGK